jgi:hypothetical protein
MVVVPKPAVKGNGALPTRAVDRAVGPAADQRADEAFRLAVRLRPVRTAAQVADPERPTGESVDRRAVGRAVVGQDALHGDPVAGEEGERAAQEGNRGRRPLVGEHFGIGEAAVVVDCDVDVLPADGATPIAGLVGEGGVVVLLACDR